MYFNFRNLVRDSKNPSHHCTSAKDMLKLFLSFCDHVRKTEVFGFDASLETIAPFPNIFSEYINRSGFVESFTRPSTTGNLCFNDIHIFITFINTNSAYLVHF